MPRPSKNTDKQLIAAAKRLLPKVGFRGLTVRDICREAGVNPGMFAYHFKTKERFLEQVMTQVYEEFFATFSLEVNKQTDPYEQLRNALVTLGLFIRDNRRLIYPVIQELFLGNRQLFLFARQNMTRHIFVIVRLIDQCQRRGHVAAMPIPMVIMTLMVNIAAPNFIGEFMKSNADLVSDIIRRNVPMLRRLFSAGVGAMVDHHVMTDAAVRRRVAIALNAVARPPKELE